MLIDNNDYDVDYDIFREEQTQYRSGQGVLASMVIPVTNMRAYRTYSTEYKDIPPCSSRSFQRPELHFWAVDEKLRILGSSVELNIDEAWDSDTQEQVMKVLGPEWSSMNSIAPYYIGSGWFRNLLQAIHFYLLQQHFTEYYANLLRFKWYTGLRSFPLFDRYEYINLIDGKLFGLFPFRMSRKGEYHVDPYRLLTTGTVNDEIKRMGGVIPPEYKGIKTAVSKLAQQLVDLHRNDPLATIDYSAKLLAATYQEGRLEYIPTFKSAKFSPHSNCNPLSFPSLGPIERNVKFSQELENCLFSLTGGDLNKLDLLAEFFARIVCSTVPSKYLWYIHGHTWYFGRFLSQFVDYRTSDLLYSSKGNKQDDLMIYNQALNIPIQCNFFPLSTDRFANLNHNKLKRYINGGEILEIDDPYQIAEVCNYYPTVIFLSEGDTIDTSKAFKNLPWREICVPDGWTTAGLSLNDVQWLKTCLVARGLQIIDGSESRHQESIRPDLEQIARQFVNKFCKEDPGSYIDSKAFYDAISKYIDTLPHAIQLPGSTKFLNSVEQWIGRKRKVIRSNKNRKGFDGIRLNEDKLESALAENEARKEQVRRERAERSFHDYLNDITSLVIWSN